MPEHENPGPGTDVASETEDPVAITSPQEPDDAPPAPGEPPLGERLGEIEHSLHSLTERLDADAEAQKSRMAELSRATLAALKRMAGAYGASRVEIEQRLESVLDRRLSGVPVELSDALGARVRSSMEGVDDRTAGALDGLRSSVQGLEDRISGVLSGIGDATQVRLAAAVDEVTGALRQLEGRLDTTAGREDVQSLQGELDVVHSVADRIGATVTSVLESLDALRGLPGQIAESMGAVQQAIDDTVGAQEDIDERLKELGDSLDGRMSEFEQRLGETLAKTVAVLAEDRGRLGPQMAEVTQTASEIRSDVKDTAVGLREELTALRMEQAARAETLQAALGRIDRLAGVLESLGQRRGFRDLMDSEERLRQEQASYVERLAGAGEFISGQLQALEDRLVEFAREGDENMAALVDEVRQEMGKAGARKAPAAELKEVSRLQAELESVTVGLRTELAEVRKRMESWGRPRAAPRLAEEIGALEGRVREVERTLQADLVEAVLTRLQRLFDRRFEALVQLVDARLLEIAEALEQPQARRGGGGLFRRTE